MLNILNLDLMSAGQVIGYFAEIAASSEKARDTSQVGVINMLILSPPDNQIL